MFENLYQFIQFIQILFTTRKIIEKNTENRLTFPDENAILKMQKGKVLKQKKNAECEERNESNGRRRGVRAVRLGSSNGNNCYPSKY